MTSPEDTPPASLLAGAPRPLQWAALLALSAAFTAVLELASLPAAFLIGPMIAGIVVATNGAMLAVPKLVVTAAFAIVGVMIATSIEATLFASIAAGWPVLVAVTLATLAASSVLGWLISRWKVMPGTTAIWGSAPGAATAMVLMADAFGADARLVAFMHYVRVIMVSVIAALIAQLFVDTSHVEHAAAAWFPTILPVPFAMTLFVALAGAAAGRLCRLPSGDFLGPLILAVALHIGGGVAFQLPPWLLAATYAVVGWSVGLRFTRQVLSHALRSLPQIMLAVAALIAFCAGIAWLLAHYLGIDPLTAYLATSPGGMDTVAIIAAASDTVDMAFVMSVQMMRFLIVLVAGPPVARWLVRRGEI